LRTIPGVTISLAAVDCLDTVKTKELFANLEYPVAGVFYLAVRLNDQLFTNLTTEEDWKTGTCSENEHSDSPSTFLLVCNVKVEGIKILLQAVDPAGLDFLVLTSSMATVCGSPGR
jgi:fatty acid synthase